jgi:hypothetical protein
MADDDKILQFPGGGKLDSKPDFKPKAKSKGKAPEATLPSAAVGPDGLSEDQRKAVQIVLSGMPFVLIGIKATDRGADFFTALNGEAADLRNAQPHLEGVIERAFSRKGI